MNITEDGTLLVVPHAKENTATEWNDNSASQNDPQTAWDVNINGVLLDLAVTIATLVIWDG